ncbi:MAG: hypothetical protein H6509_16355 [Bryobacterales bacterium]|nr:hypothetical protein [Bryobacterales bacterium]
MRRSKLNLTFFAAPILLAALLAGCASNGSTAEADEISAPQPGETANGGGGFLSKVGLAKAEPVVIPAGTRIRVRTTSTLSTKSNTSGESFVATIAEPVTVNGKTVFDTGDRAMGVVSFAEKSGRVKGVARIGAQLTEIDGNAVATKSYVVVADKTYGKDATKIGIGAGVGAAIGAIAGGGSGAAKGAGVGAGGGTGAVLATRGDPAVIPAESIIWFELESPLTVEN